ncbi:hypothetical protein NBRC110019_21240 [Neptunitalea chrysea]|uniref:DUF350 domain-containing protein n=1 Tax=Neptunitalea chrysea TaxID=1647581 RepID=A0A9W6B849_9FLAO|nr:DUF350 domain-containing protein [Neptunitalea chrysea]GLB53084.1 hypothetical protein NBRC110019_21240 [Neptunitalea chrysea]
MFQEFSYSIYNGLIYIALAFVFFFLGKLIYQLLHKDIRVKEELVVKDNLAFSFAHVGYFVGLLLAIGSAIAGPSKGLVEDCIEISIYAALALVLLNISVFITDKVVLRRFSVQKEIVEDQNSGTGIIEGAVSIASGLIIFGAISGESESITHGMYTTVLFWGAGQLLLILTTRVYNWITPYDIHEHLEKDNVAVGVGFAGALIAIANLIRFAITGVFETMDEVAIAGIEVAGGLLILPVMRFLTDKILLPGASLTDEIVNQEKANIGAALVEAFGYIGGSVLLTWCI